MSAVRFRPWPPLKKKENPTGLFSSDRYQQGYLDEDRFKRTDGVALLKLIPVFDAFEFVDTTAMAEEVERLKQQ